MLASVTAPERLSDTLDEARTGERRIAQVGTDEVLELASRDRHLWQDLESAGVRWEVHPVITSGTHELAVAGGGEVFGGAIVGLQAVNLTEAGARELRLKRICRV